MGLEQSVVGHERGTALTYTTPCSLKPWAKRNDRLAYAKVASEASPESEWA